MYHSETRSETKKRYNESEMQMITKQLKQLCIVKNCFIFESRVYELLYTSKADRKKNLKMNMKHKYRFMISDDDYDYVTDSKLRKRLDRFITKENIYEHIKSNSDKQMVRS